MQILKKLNGLVNWARLRRRPQSYSQTLEGLDLWRQTPLARAIIDEQKAQVAALLSDLFGYHLLELSSVASESFACGSRINHCFKLCPESAHGAQALSELERLPLEDDSIDVVLLHHVLDFAVNPHQVLREANRIVIPRGHLIIVGFNPLSLQGVWRFIFQWFSRNSFWRRHSLGAWRIADWLNVLDCEPVALQRGFFRPPVNHEKILAGMKFWERLCQKMKLPFGGYYILVARKDRVVLRPIKPLWGNFKPVVGLMGDPAPRLPQVVGQNSLHKHKKAETSLEKR
ncbi:MAG: class I SAM-dependent methyltransferase [Gammaproteobacteria bacterium]|nr:class I SAM-dependent methyltransferase [Gammaproteobacteria bacterium]